MIREFFLGFIKLHLLHHAAEEPIYGSGIMGELERHGYRLSPGTIYPILHELEDRGYLYSEKRVVGGKARRYYRATEAGMRALQEAIGKARELMTEIDPGG